MSHAAIDFPELVKQYPHDAPCEVNVSGMAQTDFSRVWGVNRNGYIRCYVPRYGKVNPVTCDFRQEDVTVTP